MHKLNRQARRARHAERTATEQLARELSTYTTASDLADLDAILRRHHDAAEAEKVRRLVNWSSAA